MNSIFRRKSGIYFARLVVPAALRTVVGKRELIASTGLRDLALAKVVAGVILAGWRQHLLRLRRVAPMDLLQLTTGSPLLTAGGLLSLADAASATGLYPDELLQQARTQRLPLFVDAGSVEGYLVPIQDLDRDPSDGSYDLPQPRHMPETSRSTNAPGVLRVAAYDNQVVLAEVEKGTDCLIMLFELPGQPDTVFLPTDGLPVTRSNLRFEANALEQVRQFLAASVTPQQVERASASRMTPKGSGTHKRVSEAIDAYMRERSRSCKPDHARRIRGGCELFSELMENPRLADIHREMLRRYRDEVLTKVPANENKIRLTHGTKSVAESIKAVQGTNYQPISASELAKRMEWLCGMFAWLRNERWLEADPAVDLASVVRPGKRGPERLKRDLYTADELQLIFSAAWFKTGRGELTRVGTYREFIPYFYWLPLMGLYTGARINELCQLALADVRQTAAGTWFFDITEIHGDDKTAWLKNSSSFRQVPVHRHLIELGLLSWRERLASEGYAQLFPALRFDAIKGYSKAAVKWYSRFAKGLGWERNGKKVFHSFRHTLASQCLNELGLSEPVTAQISGHSRSNSVLGQVYRKDVVPDQLAPTVQRLDFGLPKIAPFDIDQGVKALHDALQRRRRAASGNS